jgi:Matrixin
MRTSKLALFIALGLICSTAVSAYVLLSPRRTWDSPPNVRVDNRGNSTITDGDGGASRTRSAILTWNSAGSGTRLSATVASVSGWRLGDGIVMLNFRDPQRACTGGCLAATFTGYYTQRSNGTYRIFDADIVTNPSVNFASLGEACSGSEFYIEGVMVHEVGHMLGLGHSNVSGATMFPSVSGCNNGPASLASDDINAINALY